MRTKSPTSKAMFALLVGLLSFLFPTTSASADSLGIQVEIDVGSDPSNRSDSYRLWFTGEQGTSVTRTLRVAGLSETDQSIVVELFDKVSENGQVSTDFSKPSRFTDWLSVNPQNAVVKSGEILELDLTLNIPADARDQAFDGTIRVYATDATPQSTAVNPDAKYRAVVSGGLAITLPFRLGVGAELVLAPTFEITGVEGVLIDNERYLRTFFRNQGALPIILSGSLQLADPVFQDRVFGPYDFKTQEIAPGKMGFIDTPADPQITEGDYQAYVIAEQLGVRENRVLDVYIEFLPPGTLTFADIVPWAIAFLAASVLLVIGLRMLRSGPNPKEPKAKRPRAPKPNAPWRSGPRSSAPSQESELATEVEQFLMRLRSSSALEETTASKSEQGKTLVAARNANKRETLASQSSNPAPEIEDPWEFLIRARQSRWTESTTGQAQGSQARAKQDTNQATKTGSKRPASAKAKTSSKPETKTSTRSSAPATAKPKASTKSQATTKTAAAAKSGSSANARSAAKPAAAKAAEGKSSAKQAKTPVES